MSGRGSSRTVSNPKMTIRRREARCGCDDHGWIGAAGLEGHVQLPGERQDVGRINAGLDLACSSSLGEGFPNVIAEAMSAGVPVVATDVGDSREIVAHTDASSRRVIRLPSPTR